MANLQPPQAPEIPQVPQQGQEDQKKATWSEYGRQVYNEQYERWMPWIEDFYLRWFTKDNKASYTTKGKFYTLDKSKITGVKQVDALQDGANGLVSGQLGQDGLLQPVGDAFSREGINRAERQGRDEGGGYAQGPAGRLVDPVAEGGGRVAGGLADGARSAGGYVGGLFGGGGGKK